MTWKELKQIVETTLEDEDEIDMLYYEYGRLQYRGGPNPLDKSDENK